jgi:hypothetical protein
MIEKVEKPLTPTLSERAMLVSAPQERGEGVETAATRPEELMVR